MQKLYPKTYRIFLIKFASSILHNLHVENVSNIWNLSWNILIILCNVLGIGTSTLIKMTISKMTHSKMDLAKWHSAKWQPANCHPATCTQQNDIKENDTQQNDTQQNDT